MNIIVEELEQCKLAVHYEADAEEIKTKKVEVVNLFKGAPVKGFRQGHAPMDAIRLCYAKQIDSSLKQALAEDSFHNTVFEKKLKPHGPPKFNAVSLENNKFSCDFEMLTKPDFTLCEWKNFEIPKPPQEHTTEEVTEKMLQELRVRLGDMIPYSETDFVQMGDNVVVNYEATLDGQILDSLSTKEEMIVIGANPLKGWDDNLLGMISGETREFDFIAPPDGLPSLSGKNIHFTVTVVTGTKSIPCALDDELAKKFNKKDFNELREFCAQASFVRVENFNKAKIREAISKRMVAETNISVPNWMSISEAQYLAQQSNLDWNNMIDIDKEKIIGMAEQNVKLALILDKIREDEIDAQLSDQEVFEIIKRNLMQTQKAQDIDGAIQQLQKTGYLQIMFSRIKDENTISFILKNIKIIE
jgi:trigger factor